MKPAEKIATAIDGLYAAEAALADKKLAVVNAQKAVAQQERKIADHREEVIRTIKASGKYRALYSGCFWTLERGPDETETKVVSMPAADVIVCDPVPKAAVASAYSGRPVTPS